MEALNIILFVNVNSLPGTTFAQRHSGDLPNPDEKHSRKASLRTQSALLSYLSAPDSTCNENQVSSRFIRRVFLPVQRQLAYENIVALLNFV